MQSATQQDRLLDSSGYPPISEGEFRRICDYLHGTTGIFLGPGKKSLVTTRLGKRLRQLHLRSYREYLELVTDGQHPGEHQMMLDLLTTNETYFFREADHFDFLRDLIPWHRGPSFRVWSAASSSGEEAYSAAMVLADRLGSKPWEVVGTDISSRVLGTARRGHYSMLRTERIPPEYLRKFCLRGTGPQEGTLLIDGAIRQRVQFASVNLSRPLPDLGLFDVVFLRNALIYFNQKTKTEIVDRVVAKLKPGGYFFIGHSESLHGINDRLERVAPTTYFKAEG